MIIVSTFTSCTGPHHLQIEWALLSKTWMKVCKILIVYAHNIFMYYLIESSVSFKHCLHSVFRQRYKCLSLPCRGLEPSQPVFVRAKCCGECAAQVPEGTARPGYSRHVVWPLHRRFSRPERRAVRPVPDEARRRTAPPPPHHLVLPHGPLRAYVSKAACQGPARTTHSPGPKSVPRPHPASVGTHHVNELFSLERGRTSALRDIWWVS